MRLIPRLRGGYTEELFRVTFAYRNASGDYDAQITNYLVGKASCSTSPKEPFLVDKILLLPDEFQLT